MSTMRKCLRALPAAVGCLTDSITRPITIKQNRSLSKPANLAFAIGALSAVPSPGASGHARGQRLHQVTNSFGRWEAFAFETPLELLPYVLADPLQFDAPE